MLGILCLACLELISFLGECFLSQNGNPQNPYCSGIEGVMEAYYQSLKSVRLYGPTHFSPVINHVARLVSTLTPEGPGTRGQEAAVPEPRVVGGGTAPSSLPRHHSTGHEAPQTPFITDKIRKMRRRRFEVEAAALNI